MSVVKQTPGGLVYLDAAEELKSQPTLPSVEVTQLDVHDLHAGRRLLEVFRTLPEEAQVELFARIKHALMHRGGGNVLPRPRDDLAHKLADVFYCYGHEQEEYT